MGVKWPYFANMPPPPKKCPTLSPPKRPINTPGIRKYRVIAEKTGQSCGRLFMKNATTLNCLGGS
jgi:hypothetical protein